MAMKYFVSYHSYLKSIEPLNDAECGRLYRACLIYSMTGEEPDLRGNERFLFPMMKAQIDMDKEKYAAKCDRQRENINKRWNTTVYNGIPTYTNDTKENEKENEKENDKKENIKRKNFVPPTVEEVRAYCRERENNIDPQAFIDHYEAVGWMVGKNHMKDWKAAVRTWERRDRNGRSAASSAASGRRISEAEKKWGIV